MVQTCTGTGRLAGPSTSTCGELGESTLKLYASPTDTLSGDSPEPAPMTRAGADTWHTNGLPAWYSGFRAVFTTAAQKLATRRAI